MAEPSLGIQAVGPLKGTLRVPGDKSISHRALILGSMAEGPCRVRGLLDAKDVKATSDALRALGVDIAADGDETVITPPAQGFSEPSGPLDCGNSGTTMRLMAGLLATQPRFSVLTGDVSLRERPMARIVEPLREMGATIDGRADGSQPPLAIRGGPLRMIHHDQTVASAQVKSCLLLAGRHAGVAVREPTRSRDHTERMLRAMGVKLRQAPEGWLLLMGSQVMSPVDWVVPGDLSSAAFFLVAATLVEGSELRLPRVGVNPTRAGVLHVLKAMGAKIDVEEVPGDGAEPCADLVVRSAQLNGTRIDAELAVRSIDEVPILAVAAAFASGRTTLSGATELRHKECDRLAAVAAGLAALGVDVEEHPDGMTIWGGSPTGPAEVDAMGDHRIAMAFAVAGLAAPGGVDIRGAAAVHTSYPTFFRDLAEMCR